MAHESKNLDRKTQLIQSHNADMDAVQTTRLPQSGMMLRGPGPGVDDADVDLDDTRRVSGMFLSGPGPGADDADGDLNDTRRVRGMFLSGPSLDAQPGDWLDMPAARQPRPKQLPSVKGMELQGPA